LPDDPENTILKRFRRINPKDEQTDAEQAAPPVMVTQTCPRQPEKLIEKPADL